MTDRLTEHARERRRQQTVSEGLLWSILRARQVCSLKFRREYPIDRFIADFACVSERLVVENDGGYHDQIAERDIAREQALRSLGWDVLRVRAETVEHDAEAVAKAIAAQLGLDYAFKRRSPGDSGMKFER